MKMSALSMMSRQENCCFWVDMMVLHKVALMCISQGMPGQTSSGVSIAESWCLCGTPGVSNILFLPVIIPSIRSIPADEIL